MWKATIQVVTIRTEDGLTIHVRCATFDEQEKLAVGLVDHFGPEILDELEITEQAAT
jgi:hypothetical protein